MTASFSLFTVALGTALGWFAERAPIRTETVETAAGFLLIGGFAAIGCALPVMI
jgi:uncharacterized membrane protein